MENPPESTYSDGLKKQKTIYPDIINDAFFKYLLLDPYLKESSGAFGIDIAQICLAYLEPNLKTQENLIFNAFKNCCMEDKSLDTNYEVVLSGFTSENGGHQIIILIENLTNDSHNVFLINSGDGIQYHESSESAQNLSAVGPIIIKYTSINSIQIAGLKKIVEYLVVQEDKAMTKRTRDIKKIMDRDKYKSDGIISIVKNLEEPYNMLIQPFLSGENMEKGEVDMDVHYKAIRNLFGNVLFTQYKHDQTQLSDSCTVYSTLYFLKHFIFPDHEEYESFLKNVKKVNCDYFINEVFLKLKPETPNMNTIVNISHLLLKDHVSDGGAAEHMITLYSNFLSSGIGDIRNVNINDKFIDFLKAYEVFYEEFNTYKDAKDKKTESYGLDILNRFYDKIFKMNFDNETEKVFRNIAIVKSAVLHNNAILDFIQNGDILLYEAEQIADPKDIANVKATYTEILNRIPYNSTDYYTILSSLEVTKFAVIIVTNSFLSLFKQEVKPTKDFNITDDGFELTDIEVQTCISNMFYKAVNVDGTGKFGGFPLSFNFFKAYQQILALRGYLYTQVDKIKGKFVAGINYTLNFQSAKNTNLFSIEKTFGSSPFPCKDKNNPFKEVTFYPTCQSLVTLISSINSDVIINAEPFIEFIHKLYQKVQLFKPEETDPLLYSVNPGQRGTVMLSAKKNPTFDLIEQALRTLNKAKFLENIRNLNNNTIDIVVYILFIFDRLSADDIKIIHPYLDEKSYMKSILEKNVYDKFKSFNWTDELDDPGRGPALFRRLNIFMEIFLKTDKDTDLRLGNEILSKNLVEIKAIDNVYSFTYDLQKWLYNYSVYKKGSDYFYIRDGKFIQVKYVDTHLEQIIGAKVYQLIPSIEFQGSISDKNLSQFYKKLLYSKIECKVWKNMTGAQNDIYIYLDDYEKSHFKIENSSIKFIDHEGIYDVLTSYDSLTGIWAFNMKNGFLISKKGDISLLLFMNKKFLDAYQKDKDFYFWNYRKVFFSLEKREFPIAMNKTHILNKIPIHNTNLFLKTANYDECLTLFISLHLADNMIGLNLMYNTFKIFLLDEKARESSIYKFTEEISNMNNPLWPLYSTLTTMKKNIDLLLREKYFSIPFIDNKEKYILKLVTSTEKYSQISTLAKYLRSIKKDLSEKAKNVADASDLLHTYLQDFRYQCNKCKDVPSITANTSYTAFHGDDIFKKSLIYKNNYVLSTSNIYIECLEFFYSIMYEKLFKRVKNSLDTFVIPSCSNSVDFDCSQIIKTIELLDENVIYGLNNERAVQDILFEIQEGVFLRTEQKTVLDEKLYNNIDDGKIVEAHEILMGRGKTSTLTPMLLLYYYLKIMSDRSINDSKKNVLVTIVLPSHLVLQSYNIVSNLSNILHNIHIVKSNDINTYIALQENTIHIVSDSYLKSITLDLLGSNKQKPSLYIFDEVDTLINPLKSYLNKPMPPEKTHPNIEYIVDTLLEYFMPTSSKPIQNTRKNGKSSVNSTGNTRTVLNNIVNSKVQSQNMAVFKPHIKEKLSQIVPYVEKMVYNQTYGFGRKLDKALNIANLQDFFDYFTAIPYKANYSPVNGSGFADFEIAISLTILSYKKNNLRIDDTRLILLTIMDYIGPFLILGKPNSIKMIEYIYADFVPYLGADKIYDIIIQKDLNKPIIQQELQLAHESLKDKKPVITYYLKNIIFKRFFKIHEHQLNISNIDLFDERLSNKKVCFSGTVNFNVPADLLKEILTGKPEEKEPYTSGQISIINNDKVVSGSIEASFHGITHMVDKVPQVFENGTDENGLISFLKTNLGKYNALIDCAGLLLNTSVKELIKILYTVAKSEYPSKRFLYVYNEEKWIYNGDEEPMKYNNTQLEGDIFIYYDHKNCVGIDFKQPHFMKGLVTISKKNTLTEASQAIFRLRNINVGHSVDFYLTYKLTENSSGIHSRLSQLYKKLADEDKKLKTKSVDDAKLQCLKYAYRKIKNWSIPSYMEEIFYDLCPYENIYKDYKSFMGSFIDRYTTSLGSLNMGVDSLGRNLELQQLREVEEIKEEEKEEEEIIIKEEIFQKTPPRDPSASTDLKLKTTDYCDFNKFTPIQIGTPSVDSGVYITHYYLYNGRKTCSEYFILSNKQNMDKILIISPEEHFQLVNTGLSGEKCANLRIYNQYGFLVYPLEENPAAEKINIDNYLKLVSVKNLSIIEQMKLIKSMSYSEYSTINVFEKLLNKYNFNTALSEADFNSLDTELYESWAKLFKITIKDPDFQEIILQSLKALYLEAAPVAKKQPQVAPNRGGYKKTMIKHIAKKSLKKGLRLTKKRRL